MCSYITNKYKVDKSVGCDNVYYTHVQCMMDKNIGCSMLSRKELKL